MFLLKTKELATQSGLRDALPGLWESEQVIRCRCKICKTGNRGKFNWPFRILSQIPGLKCFLYLKYEGPFKDLDLRAALPVLFYPSNVLWVFVNLVAHGRLPSNESLFGGIFAWQ